MYDYFIPDPVLHRLTDVTYKELYSNDYKTYRELISEITMLEFFVEQAKLFEFKDDNLNQAVSYFFEVIYSNKSLSVIDRSDVFKKAISKLNIKTSSLISALSKTQFNIEQNIINDFYIREWTTILRNAYLNDDIKTFQNVLNIKNDAMLGIAENQIKCFKEIAMIILMMMITDQSNTFEYKNKFLQSTLTHTLSARTTTIVEYVQKMRFEGNYKDCFKNMWEPYRNMVFLTKRWKERVQVLSSFDYSPEIFYLLYLIFKVKPDCYLDLFYTFPLQAGRLDRFDAFSEKFSNHLNNVKSDNVMSDFMLAFSIDNIDKKTILSNIQRISKSSNDAIRKQIKEQDENLKK